MASGGSFGISISVKDQASGPLDSLNKRLERLSAPAERMNRALNRFGDVSGINRVAEGVGSLSRTAEDAFRNVDRISGPLGAITGAASIAGLAALTTRWAELGSQVGRTAMRMTVPIGPLSQLQGAGSRFGATADAVSGSLAGLEDRLRSAVFRGGDAAQIFSALKIDPGTPGHIADTMKTFDAIADKVASVADPNTKLRIATSVGIDPTLLPLLNLGSKGVHKELQRQADLGGTVTLGMVESATKTQQAFADLGTAIGGVANKLGTELGNAASGWISRAAQIIGKNQEVTASYAKVGAEILGTLAILRTAGPVLRLFGLGALANPVIPAAAVAGAGAYDIYQRPFGNIATQEQEDALLGRPSTPRTQKLDAIGRWLTGTSSWLPRAQQTPISVPSGPSSAAATMQRVHDLLRQGGLSEERTAGILSSVAAESGFDPSRLGDNGTSYGLFQYHGDRLAKLRERYRTATPSADQQVEFALDELKNGPQRRTWDRLNEVNSPGQSAFIFSTGFENPAGGTPEAMRRAQAAGQFVQAEPGHVQVDVRLSNAPPGTTVKTTASGPVSVSPARIEKSLP